MNKNFFSFITAAIFLEGIITYINQFFIKGEFSWQMLASVVLGIGFAAAYRLDLPSALGMQSAIPYIGSILTGILISRGSNYIFDLLKQITSSNA